MAKEKNPDDAGVGVPTEPLVASAEAGETYTTVEEFKRHVKPFRLSRLNLQIEIQTEEGTIHVLARRPTVEVLDGMQRLLKETGSVMSERIKDVVTYQLVPLLLAWNLTDDAGDELPFDAERIVKEVPADILNTLVTQISNAVMRPQGVPDPNAPASS